MHFNTIKSACINQYCPGFKFEVQGDWCTFVLPNKNLSNLYQSDIEHFKPPFIRERKILKSECIFDNELYMINWCSDCEHLKNAIHKVNFKEAINLIRPKDILEFIHGLIDEYYKELERQELYVSDMFGTRHKLLNAPISMRFSRVKRGFTFNQYGYRSSASDYGYRNYLGLKDSGS
jgi:hypothetical protein